MGASPFSKVWALQNEVRPVVFVLLCRPPTASQLNGCVHKPPRKQSHSFDNITSTRAARQMHRQQSMSATFSSARTDFRQTPLFQQPFLCPLVLDLQASQPCLCQADGRSCGRQCCRSTLVESPRNPPRSGSGTDADPPGVPRLQA